MRTDAWRSISIVLNAARSGCDGWWWPSGDLRPRQVFIVLHVSLGLQNLHYVTTCSSMAVRSAVLDTRGSRGIWLDKFTLNCV